MVKTKHNSKSLITFGFSSIIVLILVVITLWINAVSESAQVLNEFQEKTADAKLISIMRNATHKRAIKLYQMTTIEDPFERDDIYMQIRALGSEFITARNKYFSNSMEEDEIIVWNKARKNLNQGGQLQHEVAELIFNNETEKAQTILREKIIPTQDAFIKELDTLLEISTNKATLKFNEVNSENGSTYTLIYLLGISSVLLGIFTIIVIRRTGKTDAALSEQGERIRALYEVSARADLTPDEQITETLRLGCRLLDMEIGKVGLLDTEENTSTFLNTVAPPELPIKRGKILPLDKTYCNLTFNSPGPIALHHVGESEYQSDPSYKFLGMEAYIGTTIHVNGEKFGTVHFVNRKPRKKPFTDTDKDMLNLIGSWVAVTFERQIAQEEMKKSKNSAEAANRSKSAFLANMSHEIRTPLTAIIGYSEMLRDEDQTQEDREHEISSIIRSGSHLQQIINDILDLSKIEAGQLVIEQLKESPFHIVADINSIMSSRAEEKGLNFSLEYDYPLPKHVTTDPTRFKQILFNIIGNAIKFTQKGSIGMRMGYSGDNNKLIITISDTGIGMSPQEMERLFKPFSQADSSTTREFGGTGLGLCISRQLANNLGGDITYSSTKGEGSKFTISIDAGNPAEIELIEGLNNELLENLISDTSKELDFDKEIKNISLAGKHILLAEDALETQKLVSIYIKKTGAEVTITENGQAAVKLAQSENFDLILMDVQMPVMDGLEATALLRKAGYDRPIVALTANAMKEDRDKCIDAGTNDYLTKPINLKEFYSVLHKYLNKNDNEASEEVSEEVSEELSNILTAIPNDPEYQKLEQGFIEHMPEIMEHISNSVTNSEWQELVILLKKLKAESGEFGFTEISNLAEVIYTKIINQQHDDITANVLSLNSLSHRIASKLPQSRKVS